MSIETIVGKLNAIAWGTWMLLLLVGTGVYLSCRVGFIQFAKFGYTMRNTLGKVFKKTQAGEGEVTPFQAVATAWKGVTSPSPAWVFLKTLPRVLRMV